jgi:hypothetical protein
MEMSQARLPDPTLEERIIRVPLHTFQRLQSFVSLESPMDGEDIWLTYQRDEHFLAMIVKQIARAQPVPRPLKLLTSSTRGCSYRP